MCGIIGVSANFNITKMLTEGLERLEYRGYDSAGFGLIECSSKKLIVLKDVGRIRNIIEKYNVESYCAIAGVAHTRWATHGPPTKENAHPHTDCKNEIGVVHNGIIKNYLEIKKELLERGHVFKSQTDTEVVAHFLEDAVKQGYSMLEALRLLVNKIKGAYALVIVYSREPYRLYFARNLSPLVIGVGKGFNIVSSDIPSFIKYTRNVVIINDGEIGYISPTDIYIEKNGVPLDFTRRIHYVTWSVEDAEKGGYPHFMLKEIDEQPRALNDTWIGLQSDDAVAKAVEVLVNSEKIFVTGAGTSYHAALAFQLYMYRLAKRPVIAFISSEHSIYSEAADNNTVLIAISQSGETIDTLQAVRAFRQRGAKVVAVSNVIASSIPRESNIAVYMRAGPEIGVAATKTFLTQLLTLHYMLTGYLEAMSDKDLALVYRNLLAHASKVTSTSIARSRRVIERLAWKLRDAANMYILSREEGVALALEAALKIKEVSYIHAEAYPAGESKHGPIALVEKDFPVIFIIPSISEGILNKLQSNIMEMKARGAFTIAVGPSNSVMKEVEVFVDVGQISSDILIPYAVIPPLQVLAYRLAVLKGYDPDKPRNLAKTVTVE